MSEEMKETAYKQAGVDIDAGNELVERIKPAIKNTMRKGVMGGVGGFGAFFDLKETGYKDPVLVSSTDGVGTKIAIAIETGRHDTIGIDLVAMCVNDLIVQGAEPLFFLDYFASGKLEVETAQAVIEGIARGCQESGCALIGGETAEMPGMYKEGDYDLAGFCVGAVERDCMLTGKNIEEGDCVLGLASSGLHSNGFSLVRKIIREEGISFDAPAPFDTSFSSLGEALLVPTRLYVSSLLGVIKDFPDLIKGLANITGGGLIENVPRILPSGLNVLIDRDRWKMPPVFKWLAEKGHLEEGDLFRALNCGIGMVVICSQTQKETLVKRLEDLGESVYELGKVIKNESETQASSAYIR